MEKISYEPWNQKPQRRRDATSVFGVVIALLIVAGLIMAVLFPPIGRGDRRSGEQGRYQR